VVAHARERAPALHGGPHMCAFGAGPVASRLLTARFAFCEQPQHERTRAMLSALLGIEYEECFDGLYSAWRAFHGHL
jgi:hypothetical protein